MARSPLKLTCALCSRRLTPASRTVTNGDLMGCMRCSASLFNHVRRRTAKMRKVFLLRSQDYELYPVPVLSTIAACLAGCSSHARQSLPVHHAHATRTLPACLPEPPCPRHP